MNNIVAVFRTHQSAGVPHIDVFIKKNSNVICMVEVTENSKTVSHKHEMWRNNDRSIKNWWLNIGKYLVYKHVFFIEYDTFFDLEVEKFKLDSSHHYVCKNIKQPDDKIWVWNKEIPNLPIKMQKYALGTPPLGVIIFSKECLDSIMYDKECFDLFDQDIFCELRLPTLVNYKGFALTPTELLKNTIASEYKVPIISEGIYHAIKKRIV